MEKRGNLLGPIFVKSTIPKHRQELLRWNGWGYKDSKFVVEFKEPLSRVYLTGNRYAIGEKNLPYVEKWIGETFNVRLDVARECRPLPAEHEYPKPNVTPEVMKKISELKVSYSIEGIDRLIRAHGHTLHDIFTLMNSNFERIPDVVLWPTSHQDVVKIVNLANQFDIVIIPFGGGTAVSGAVECPKEESRSIISLDTTQMNKILWIDVENLVACCESGIIGQDLERELGKLGFTSGHEPDSYEFSSLGGWVATRASGMKKNRYGNIEDIVIHVKMVTSKGTLEKNCQVPRISCGPDFNHIILGSEGSLGVVTEVIIKIQQLPKLKKYGSLVFPNFELGLNCMREIAKRKLQPASIRLMDNEQFQLAQMFKTESTVFKLMSDGLAKFYITKIKGFDVNQMSVMTLLFEGEADHVKINEKKLMDVAKKYYAVNAGEENGKMGYMLTFVIAYVRDFALQYGIVAESFETSVPWSRALTLVKNVKQVIAFECRRMNIKYFLINSRVTQTYDAGCVIYFYLAFNYNDVEDPVPLHQELENKARDEIIACGGSISHHHGVGKLRKKWYPLTVSDVGVDLLLATKHKLDPKNIFATNNFLQSKM